MLIVLMLLFVNGNVFAYPNEANGFRQYKWGMSMKNVMARLGQDRRGQNLFNDDGNINRTVPINIDKRQQLYLQYGIS